MRTLRGSLLFGTLSCAALGHFFQELVVSLDHGLTGFENKEKKQANAEEYINNVEDKAAGRLGTPAKPVGRIHRHRHSRVSQRVEKSAPFS